MRESDIEKHLVKRVQELGGEVRKVSWIGRRSAPDRLVMLPVREAGKLFGGTVINPAWTIWVELKATGKKPTTAQLREHKRLRDVGQWVEVIDSIEGVEELLK